MIFYLLIFLMSREVKPFLLEAFLYCKFCITSTIRMSLPLFVLVLDMKYCISYIRDLIEYKACIIVLFRLHRFKIGSFFTLVCSIWIHTFSYVFEFALQMKLHHFLCSHTLCYNHIWKNDTILCFGTFPILNVGFYTIICN